MDWGDDDEDIFTLDNDSVDVFKISESVSTLGLFRGFIYMSLVDEPVGRAVGLPGG